MDGDRYGLEILAELRSLALPSRDYAVFGSGPLLVRGIIDTVPDLDVLCRGEAWRVAQRLASSETIEHGQRVVSIYAISFGTEWGIGCFDTDQLISGAEIIDRLPFVAMKHVVAYKRLAGRPKDIAHLQLIAAWQDADPVSSQPTSRER